MDKSRLATEAKAFQGLYDIRLPKKSYCILQLDGKAFHTYTKGLELPFDDRFIKAMDDTAKTVLDSLSNAKFAYVQSDEINIFLTDLDGENQEPFYGNRVQKIVSTSAGFASAFMSRQFPEKDIAVFDGRYFATPTVETTANFFIWRQLDAIKNSIQATGQAHFSSKELDKKHSGLVKEMLLEKGVVWEDLEQGKKMGRLISREETAKTVTYVHKKTGIKETIETTSYPWVSKGAPFLMDDSFLTDIVPVL